MVAAREPEATIRPSSAAIVNLGCKVNQSEMEAAARLLRRAGVPLVDPSARADLYLVNTCTVTSIADEKSRAAVRRARRANPDARVVVTGCSVQVDPGAFEAVDAEARLVGNDDKAAFLAELEALLGVGDTHGPLAAPLPTLSGVDREVGVAIDGVADDRASVEKTRAFVKVQDGCSFFCTYCIIPRARGAERSLPAEQVLADVRRALAAGHREIVLTGINIGTYDGGWSERGHRGSHTASALTLAQLVRRILDETAVERIRLSSIEPQHVDDELLTTWADGAPRTLPHLHLPLQSGDDGVLRRMGRRYLTPDYARVVERARKAPPGRRRPRRRHRRLPDRGRRRLRPLARLHPRPRPRGPPRLPLLGPPRDPSHAHGRPGPGAGEEAAGRRAPRRTPPTRAPAGPATGSGRRRASSRRRAWTTADGSVTRRTTSSSSCVRGRATPRTSRTRCSPSDARPSIPSSPTASRASSSHVDPAPRPLRATLPALPVLPPIGAAHA